MERERILDKMEFADFVLKYEDKLRDIADLLAQPFEDNIANLEKQISVVSSKMETLSWCLACAEEFLTNAKFEHLPLKRKDLTEMDRGVSLDFSTSKETLLKDWVRGMCEDIDKYLSNAQSILATKRAELQKLGYGGGE